MQVPTTIGQGTIEVVVPSRKPRGGVFLMATVITIMTKGKRTNLGIEIVNSRVTVGLISIRVKPQMEIHDQLMVDSI